MGPKLTNMYVNILHFSQQGPDALGQRYAKAKYHYNLSCSAFISSSEDDIDMRIDLQYSPTMAKPAIHRKIRKCKHQEQIFVVDQMPKVDARS